MKPSKHSRLPELSIRFPHLATIRIRSLFSVHIFLFIFENYFPHVSNTFSFVRQTCLFLNVVCPAFQGLGLAPSEDPQVDRHADECGAEGSGSWNGLQTNRYRNSPRRSKIMRAKHIINLLIEEKRGGLKRQRSLGIGI